MLAQRKLTSRHSPVYQIPFSEKAVFNTNSDGQTPAADKKKTFEKREK